MGFPVGEIRPGALFKKSWKYDFYMEVFLGSNRYVTENNKSK
jgi:hypothetical protein